MQNGDKQLAAKRCGVVKHQKSISLTDWHRNIMMVLSKNLNIRIQQFITNQLLYTVYESNIRQLIDAAMSNKWYLNPTIGVHHSVPAFYQNFCWDF